MPPTARLRTRLLLVLASTGLSVAQLGCHGADASASSGAGGAGGIGGYACIHASGTPPSSKDTTRVCLSRDELEPYLICGNPMTAASSGSSGAGGNGGGGGAGDSACVVGDRCPELGEIRDFAEPCDHLVSGPWAEGCDCCYAIEHGGFGAPPSLCGRPFTIAGAAVRACAVARSDWSADELCVDDAESELSAPTRAALASAWLEDARLEHASIASFARFSLHLLALGAPADLVAAAQRASADEVAHAQACFALASRYVGAPLGPGPLAIDGALQAPTLVDAAVAAVREGCVGETIAAHLAAERLARAEDPHAREVLARIAEDEAAHAELAYRFVAWAIRQGGEVVRRAVSRAFAEEIARGLDVPALAAGADEAACARHGVLAPARANRASREALRAIVVPCADALAGGRVLPMVATAGADA